MKKKFLIFAVSGLIAGAIFTACNSPEKDVEKAADNVAEAQVDLNKAEAAFAEEWEKFRIESEASIQKNESEIALFREMEKSDKIWSAKYRSRIDELEAKNSALRAKVDSYKAEKRQENWEAFKAEFKHDMDELGTALKDFSKDNKK